MSIRQAEAAEPMPLHQVVAVVLDVSAEREEQLQRRLRLAAYAFGYEDGVEAGRRQVLDEEAAARRAMAGIVLAGDQRSHDELERVRRSVRGEPRTRATFGQPHKDDYPGNGAA